jgi:hypothetical protein
VVRYLIRAGLQALCGAGPGKKNKANNWSGGKFSPPPGLPPKNIPKIASLFCSDFSELELDEDTADNSSERNSSTAASS